MSTREVFLSYARADAAAAAAVEADLAAFGAQVWRDDRIGGGQDWWAEILDRIRACDAFVVVVTAAWTRSSPCARELAYATALGKPVLPVRAGTPLPPGVLPREVARLQLVDHGDDRASALRLVRALGALPAPGPLPDPLPEPPEAPLSYTTELATLVHASRPLDVEEQRLLVQRLGSGVADGHEDVATDCRTLLTVMHGRADLEPSVKSQVGALLQRVAPPPAARPTRRPPDPGAPFRFWDRPVVTPLLCAAWLVWLAVRQVRESGEYASPWFALLAALTAVASAVEWTRAPAWAAWLLVITGQSGIAAFVFVKEMDRDQSIFVGATFTVVQALLLVVALRLRRRPRASGEDALAVFVALCGLVYALRTAMEVAAKMDEYGAQEVPRALLFGTLLAAAGVCVWTFVVNRFAPADREAPAARAG